MRHRDPAPAAPFRGRPLRALAPALALALTAGAGGGCPHGEVPPLDAPRAIEAVIGDGGVAVFVDRPLDADVFVEAAPADADVYPLPFAGATVVVDPDGAADTRYTLLRDRDVLDEALPRTLALAAAATTPDPPLLLDGEAVTLTLQLDAVGLALAAGALAVTRRVDGDEATNYLSADCAGEPSLAADCWRDEPTAWQPAYSADAVGEAVTLPPYPPDAGGPRREQLGVALLVTDDDGRAVVAGDHTPLVVTGVSLRWGDLHGHTNLSNDGCEDVDDICRNRRTLPGEDFFDQALDAGLDFAALTDHSEWHVLHSAELQPIDIWQATQALVAEALVYEADGFVPLLGYEWTRFVTPWEFMEQGEDPTPYMDEFDAGHKTVLFRETSACAEYRINAGTVQPTFVKGESGMWYTHGHDSPVATTAEGFYQLLDQAAETCEPREVIAFYHHPGTLIPTPINWQLADNDPDPDVEMLLEIASEHGAAECVDPEDDGCGFRRNEVFPNTYVGWGSAQAALAEGHRFGFVGGTDSHDGKPGTVFDTPSHTGHWHDTDGDGIVDSPIPHYFGGAITGALVGAPFARDTLWDALCSRHTLASTGPRGALAVAAIDTTGEVHLPGDAIAADRFPLTVWVRAEPDAGEEIEAIELIEPDAGGTLAGSDDATALATELADPGSGSFYVRVRAWADDDEHRVWFSPLFIDRD